MWYKFETGKPITMCMECPLVRRNFGECNYNDKEITFQNATKEKPSWCPLILMEGEKE